MDARWEFVEGDTAGREITPCRSAAWVRGTIPDGERAARAHSVIGIAITVS
jgi:hypothetical protein